MGITKLEQCEIGKGWYKIVEPLLDYCKATNNPVRQVKEKFGGLRFYVDNYTEEFAKLLRDAEHLSFETCEDCGAPGTLGGKRWLRTLCAPCRSDRDAQQANYNEFLREMATK